MEREPFAAENVTGCKAKRSLFPVDMRLSHKLHSIVVVSRERGKRDGIQGDYMKIRLLKSWKRD